MNKFRVVCYIRRNGELTAAIFEEPFDAFDKAQESLNKFLGCEGVEDGYIEKYIPFNRVNGNGFWTMANADGT